MAMILAAIGVVSAVPVFAGDSLDRLAGDLAGMLRTGDAAALTAKLDGGLSFSDIGSQEEQPIDAGRIVKLIKGCGVTSKEVARALDPAPIFVELACPGRVVATDRCYDIAYRLVVYSEAMAGETYAKWYGRLDGLKVWSRARCGRQPPPVGPPANTIDR